METIIGIISTFVAILILVGIGFAGIGGSIWLSDRNYSVLAFFNGVFWVSVFLSPIWVGLMHLSVWVSQH